MRSAPAEDRFAATMPALPIRRRAGIGTPRSGQVEWHPGELYPRVGFIVTNLARPAERVVAFYNQRGTAEQWIKKARAKIVCHGRYVTFQMAEVAVSRQVFAEILSLIARLRAPPALA
jgi:hypothetical protein